MQRLFRCPSRRSALALLSDTVRWVTDTFDIEQPARWSKHTHSTLPLTDSSKFGGRTSYLREKAPINARYRGRQFKKDHTLLQYNVDVWCAQQTLRKKWKGRDWDVYEMPFERAPKVLQKVIPEVHTEVPMMADPENGDFYNIRSKVFDVEDLQGELFATSAEGSDRKVFPELKRVNKEDSLTIDKFL